MSVEENQSKAARNQSLFRDVNERVRAISDGGVPASEMIGFICECADLRCAQPIDLSLAEYEAARRVPTRFPIAVGHERPDVERVVERYDRYEVVEKFGEAGEVAAQEWRSPE